MSLEKARLSISIEQGKAVKSILADN